MADLFTLVTGASSGIGRAIARRLSLDRNLVLHGRDSQRLEAAASECGQGRRRLIWKWDLAEVETLGEAFARFLQAEEAEVDCLVHCAGMVTVLPMRALDHAIARQIMNVNVLSAMELVRVLVQKKINHSALKSILFISGVYSVRGAKGHSVYAASKGALDAFMRSLAIELAPAVRVNSVLPGAIETPMSTKAFADPEWVSQMKAAYPLGAGQVEDVAEAVCFLVSEKARWITGQQFLVDGGRTAH